MIAPPSVSISFLLQRLNWPVPMVRWRAAREIRCLLENEATQPAMTRGLLEFLAQCQTESEVCSILTIVFLTSTCARPPRGALISRIKCPSILADLILERTFGPGMGMGGWFSAHSGEAPRDYAPDAYFDQHKFTQLPPIFFNRLRNLEDAVGLPFLRQWAFEWKNLRDRLGTSYTGYPHYFDSYGEAQSGIAGQFLQKQGEVFRSAHIRAFALAVSLWGMPLERAVDELLNHIPAVGGLFDIEPIKRPEWLGDFPERCLVDDSDLEGLLRDYVVSARREPFRCVSLVTPFDVGKAKYGDLYVGAYLVTEGFSLHPDQDLFEPLDPILIKETLSIFGEISSAKIEETTRKGKVGAAIPICMSLFPVPHGYWQSDYFSIGLPLIANYWFPDSFRLQMSGGTIEVMAASTVVARTIVWNDAWGPSYPQGVQPGAGLWLKSALMRFRRCYKNVRMGGNWRGS